MAYDKGKPALALRRDLKLICRELVEVHTQTQEALRKITALALDYTVDQGTSYFADPDAAAVVTLLASVQAYLQTNAGVLTKGADYGDNIN